MASSARLSLTDRDRLRWYVERGSTVYLSVADHVHGWPDEDLAGVEPVDFSLITVGAEELIWGTDRWPVEWDVPGIRRIVIRPTTARVLARFADGSPACTVNSVGSGQVVLCCLPVELTLDRPGRLSRAPWERFYQRIAAVAGVRPVLSDADLAPDLEVVTGSRDGGTVTLLVNHGGAPVAVPAALVGGPGLLAPKQWALIENGKLVADGEAG